MIERTKERFDLKPERLAADTAYGSGANLNWLVKDKKIAPHIPVIDKPKREDGTFSREVYICPAGKTLTTTGRLVNDGETLLYMASMRHCRSCPLKAQCCPKAPFRRVPRSIYEEARDVARALARTAAFEQSRHDRRFCAIAASVNSNWAPRGPRNRRRPSCRIRLRCANNISTRRLARASRPAAAARYPMPGVSVRSCRSRVERRQYSYIMPSLLTERPAVKAPSRRQGPTCLSLPRLLQQNLPDSDIRVTRRRGRAAWAGKMMLGLCAGAE
jgi:hypothetical protein